MINEGGRDRENFWSGCAEKPMPTGIKVELGIFPAVMPGFLRNDRLKVGGGKTRETMFPVQFPAAGWTPANPVLPHRA